MATFGPITAPSRGELILHVEEFEAVRLSDWEQLDQEAAAAMMEISRQTYGRILNRARQRLAEALITGKTLKIEGGNFQFRQARRRRGRRCGRGGGSCR